MSFPEFTIRAYPDFTCVTPDAVVSYHAEPVNPENGGIPKGTEFRWKCINDPATRPDSSRPTIFGPHTQHWKNARWSFPGHHTIVLWVIHPDGKRDAYSRVQWVDSASLILGREFDPKDNDTEPGPFHVLVQKEMEHKVLLSIAKVMPPPPDKQKAHDKQMEDLESYIGHLKHNLDGLSGKEAVAVDALHLDRERSQRTRLRLYLVNTTGENKKPAWTLVDWTNPMFKSTTGVYNGTGSTHTEAIEDLIRSWDQGNRYPKGGRMAYDFKMPNHGVTLSGEFETHGKNNTDSLADWLDYIAIGSAVVAGVTTLVLPIPGSRVVSAAIWTSIFTSTASATINIAQRHGEGFGNWKDDTFDGLSIVGNLFAGAATWKIGTKVASATRIGTMTKAALIGQIGTDGLQGILLGEQYLSDYQAIMDDKTLSPSERLTKIMELLRSAALAGALSYISIKGTKADIDNLNAGATRVTKADVENKASLVDVDEKVASVPVKRNQGSVETVVETESKRNKLVTDETQPVPKLKHIDEFDEFPQKQFETPKEGYDYIKKMTSDTNIIFSKNIKGISANEADLLKKNIREGLPLDDYPDVNFTKIDDAIDSISNKTLSKSDISEVKEYVFNNKDFNPPYKMKDKEFFHGFEKNIESWRKLYKGQIDEESTTFIKHELSEMKIKKAINYDSYSGQFDKILVHEDVHESVLTIFNTQK